MRMSQLFGNTLRESPSEAEVPSHALLVRAGFIRQLAAGIFSYLPLAQRSLAKIENIVREEINAIGGQEISMPVVHPADLWQRTKRWYQIGDEMGRFKDRAGRDMVLAMTHEEVVADLARQEVHSYRDLPRLIYHIQTKWRDDPRPRAGLIRVREFTMKDSYSLDRDWEGLDRQYRAHYRAYFNIFQRCRLPVRAVRSDVGMMGGSMAHEFMYLNPVGEDTVMLCDSCDYAANRQIARFGKGSAEAEPLAPLEKVATPGVTTIEGLAAYLEISAARTAKAVFLIASMADGSEQFVFAVLRGDMELNETKLANAVKAVALRPALESEIRAVGAEPGYGSPIGVSGALIVVDDMIPHSTNLVAGANEEGFHTRNVNLDRDYQADLVTDIALAQDGDPCPECAGHLVAIRAIEVGNIFKLGTRYSEAMGAEFLDEHGERAPVVLGSYGIGSGRLLASVAEEHHDERGLLWPVSVAPYEIHLIGLKGAREQAEQIYGVMQGAEVLYDDREESPGVKFADADLIGVPLRMTVSRRSLEAGGAELKRRNQSEGRIVPLGEAPEQALAEIDILKAEIAAGIAEISLPD